MTIEDLPQAVREISVERAYGTARHVGRVIAMEIEHPEPRLPGTRIDAEYASLVGQLGLRSARVCLR